ncbi:MAG: hypothetical protein U0166_17345 [Acidobacteriota bacterium]
MIEALGGLEKFDKIPYLVFTFTVEKDGAVVASRKHYWDKRNGRHRLEGGTKEGKRYVVLTDLRTQKGTAYLAGTKVEGDAARDYLLSAYNLWINDSYWLAMPFKVKDPGVILKDAGSEEVGGIKYDKIQVSFDGVGLTPRDVYWAYINPDNGRMERWSFVLGGEKKTPTMAEWKGWRQHLGVWLSDEKAVEEVSQRILFPDLSAPPILPETIFTSPDIVMPGEIPAEK